MSAEQWWIEQPPGIKMTSQRAKELLTRRSQPAGPDEVIFIEANVFTIIPKGGFVIIPASQPLSLHHPKIHGRAPWQREDD